MQGLHLTGDLFDCGCSAAILTDLKTLATLCRQTTVDSGLTVVDEKFHVFPDVDGHPGGITGALLLAESHLAVHTWPERRGVTLDVYVCNFTSDNCAKAQRLFDTLVVAFRPASQTVNRNRARRPRGVDPGHRCGGPGRRPGRGSHPTRSSSTG